MSDSQISFSDLIGKRLGDFRIIEMFGVYPTHNDGSDTWSVGFFKDQDTALAYIGAHEKPDNFRVESGLVLTDNKVGFLIGQQDPVIVFGPEEEKGIRESLLKRFSSAELNFLGIED